MALRDMMTSLSVFLKARQVRYMGRMANMGKVWMRIMMQKNNTYSTIFTKPDIIKTT